MNALRILLCIFAPPLAVLNLGIGRFALVLVMTLLGWFPGVVLALIFSSEKRQKALAK